MKSMCSILFLLIVLSFASSSPVTELEDSSISSSERQKRGTGQISFQGCFGGNPTFIKTQNRDDNINLDCAEYCKEKGFIIAATKSKFCGCTDTLPSEQIARPDSGNATGPNSQCNSRCPGVWTQGSCHGDECCGGASAYSVYVVGQIDVMKQVLRRVADNFRANKGQALINEFGNTPYRYIQHYGGKCFNLLGGSAAPSEDTRIVLADSCDEPRLWFRMLSDGSIQHVPSGKCLHPLGGSSIPADNTELVLHSGCNEGRLQFELTPGGSIRHKTSRKCLRPYGSSTYPPYETKIVLHSGCDEISNTLTLKPTSQQNLDSIRQSTSGKCLHPSGGSPNPGDSTVVVIHSGCGEPRLWFEMLPDGSIRHMTSGKCFHPKGGSASPGDNTPIVLHSGCGQSRLQFRVLSNGCIQHKTSGKCLHPSGGSAHPRDGTKLVLHRGCSNEGRLVWNFVRLNVPALPDFVIRTVGDTISADGNSERKECIMTSTVSTEKTFSCNAVTDTPTLIMEFSSMTRELEHGFGKNMKPLGQYDSELDNLFSPNSNTMTKTYSITDTVSDEFNTEAGLSLSTTFGASQSIELGVGAKSTTTVSTEISVAGFFSAGYAHTTSTETSESFTVEVDVPAYSKGLVNLFQETYPLEIKWRATMFAKGILYVSCAGVTKRFHASEVLGYTQRKVFAFGTINFGEREKIIAIVKLLDKNGNVVKEFPAQTK